MKICRKQGFPFILFWILVWGFGDEVYDCLFSCVLELIQQFLSPFIT